MVFLESNQLKSWAHVLNDARENAKPVAQLTQQMAPAKFTRADAYSIQEEQLQMRLAAGEKQIGWKMGLTSEAKRRQMNLDSPLYGFLTDPMRIENHGTFDRMSHRIHPKIEPEIAFLMKSDLGGPSVTRAEAIAACEAVCAAMEILDSRYTQFKYFSMEDVIADNSSSSDFVLGPWFKDFQKIDLTKLKMEMLADDKIAQVGMSSDISGDPIASIIELCSLLHSRGQVLKAGNIVLAGAATTAIELTPGLKIDLIVEGLPAVALKVAK